LRDDTRKVEAGLVLGEIIVEIRHELVERNRKAGSAIERCHIRDVALDQ
jgi:hypothetical protein